ncbi:STAS domain-containing protein [Actinoplanes sp. NPDC051494]|uniref:STAS domain-containing protein n=1 Tax=Actinoplanes sp. NPDC051494 TaxID=3363907 RepID=UPI00379E5136
MRRRVCCTDPVRLIAAGELARDTTPLLQPTVIDLLRRHRPWHIDVDLAGVTFLDAAVIRALLTCRADAHQLDCRLTLSNPSTSHPPDRARRGSPANIRRD